MTPPDWQHCTEEALWKFVSYHLTKNGIETVLVGGAVVAIYTQGLYQSGDLDLLVTSLFRDKIHRVMASLGFQKQGRHYIYPDCAHLFIEFPPGPLGIGEDMAIIPQEVTVADVSLKILSPTDCIKDRLASYIHFKDQEGLHQAVLVAQNQEYDRQQVKQWCLNEQSETAWNHFMAMLLTQSAD